MSKRIAQFGCQLNFCESGQFWVFFGALIIGEGGIKEVRNSELATDINAAIAKTLALQIVLLHCDHRGKRISHRW